MKPNKWLIAVPCLLILIIGCSTPNVPYRTRLQIYPGDDTNRPAEMAEINPTNTFSIETNANFKIGFVEFDDQGWFWSFKQWKRVKDSITIEASEAAKTTNGLTIVVFVHGWKNNASFDNNNVKMFRSALANVSRVLAPQKVFGVYVGWRGMSVKNDWFPIPFGKEMTFYRRKEIAERIGHQGAATQMFTELECLQDDLNAYNESNGIPRAELIVIGHSFGAQLVYSAISQILTERLVMATHNHKPLNSFGDLVVLINPAFEASLYNNLNALATSPDITYPPSQKPVLAVFTSKSDSATGFWFPQGRRMSTWYEKVRPGGTNENEIWMFNVRKNGTANETTAIKKSVGHDQEYITCDLIYTNYGTNMPGTQHITSIKELTQEIKVQQNVLATNNMASNPTNLQPYIFNNYFTNKYGATNYYACILQPRTNNFYYKPGNPFINVAVDQRIIKNHDDIKNAFFIKFLRDFILFSRTNAPSENMNNTGLN